ncbi:MAG TPA: hypothetical protein DCG51_05650 [Erysipelotrichaceae bacterium]|jgi:hypothetical protein|nr:hypothetical protein [Erysipelotrichaceae bacterium]
MPAVKVGSLQLYSEMVKLIEEYGSEVTELNEQAIKNVAKGVAKDLRKAGSFEGSGKFRKSIKAVTVKRRLGVDAQVGATAPYHRLTHLLEFGHAKANGGRTTAFNFVKPINDTVEKRYREEMEKLLQ